MVLLAGVCRMVIFSWFFLILILLKKEIQTKYVRCCNTGMFVQWKRKVSSTKFPVFHQEKNVFYPIELAFPHNYKKNTLLFRMIYIKTNGAGHARRNLNSTKVKGQKFMPSSNPSRQCEPAFNKIRLEQILCLNLNHCHQIGSLCTFIYFHPFQSPDPFRHFNARFNKSNSSHSKGFGSLNPLSEPPFKI